MKGLYDFKCINNHVIEEYIDESIHSLQCPFCQQESKRIISATQVLKMDGRPINMMEDSWAKAREKNYLKLREQNG